MRDSKKLKVWYGLRKLTPKVVKKPSIIVVFENSNFWKNENYVKRAMLILHQRFQTDEEMQDSECSIRCLSVYEMFFLNDKRFKKSPELAIQHNFKADSNNVSEKERTVIAEKLRAKIYDFYKVSEPQNLQLELF